MNAAAISRVPTRTKIAAATGFSAAPCRKSIFAGVFNFGGRPNDGLALDALRRRAGSAPGSHALSVRQRPRPGRPSSGAAFARLPAHCEKARLRVFPTAALTMVPNGLSSPV